MTVRAPLTTDRPHEPLTGSGDWHGAPTTTQIGILTARSMRALVLNRRLLIIGLLESLVMLVAFGQVFSGLAYAPGFPAGVRYVDFLLPALLLTTTLQSGIQAGIGVTDDAQSGILDRLRSMPVWPGSILIARSLAGLARGALRLAVLLALARVLFGYDPAGGARGVLAAAGLSLALSWSLGWLFIALACWIDQTEALHATAGLVMFPLMYASNAFVPVGGLPGWLRRIARYNPVSHGIDSARDLCLTGTTGPGVLNAVLAGLLIAVLAAAAAVRGLSRAR
ncbi:ABC transporter permease [Actinomadura litoris]|uniref:ABC transporter permease n=1 Tax=Actinomadura litoris TaxID=2678616 RepID=UPI0012E2DB75|nr:ABC transporter permease [Actinomadura litoris]